MNRFAFALYFPFIVSLLFAGCAASTYLMNAPEPSPEKEIRQTLESWSGIHISQAIQKWGSPHEITGEQVGPKNYIWQMSVQTPILQQENQHLSLQNADGPPSRSDTFSSSDVLYELVFYTRSDGVIYKTDIRKHQSPIDTSGWEEKHISTVIQEWGSPHGITDDGINSKIYIWQLPVLELRPREYHRIISKQRRTNDLHSRTGISVATDDTYEIMFYTRPNGVIYKTLTKRELNPSVGSRSSHFSQEKQGSIK